MSSLTGSDVLEEPNGLYLLRLRVDMGWWSSQKFENNLSIRIIMIVILSNQTLGHVPERNHYSPLWIHSPHYNVPDGCSHPKWNGETHNWNQQTTSVPLKKKRKIVASGRDLFLTKFKDLVEF
jgi:hypothetical protein